MSTVLEIQQAASRLDEHDQEALLSWLLDREAEWDKQIERDAADGKLDFLVNQAKAAIQNGTLRDWPGQP
jgi:hypothetical protein